MDQEAIPAATLIVVRERGDRPELLMVERAGGMAFAAGALVFPGGRIDESDRALGHALGLAPAAIAAVRETIEETAVPVALDPLPDAVSVRAMQDQLISNGLFQQVLQQHGVSLAPDALLPFARWVPKFHAVRRFDTLFYVAQAPEGDWDPRIIAGECSAAEWVSAAEVLEREKRGEARLIFPTRRTLERLAQHASFDAIRADGLSHPIEPISPWVEERNGEQFITIPNHLGFPVTEERLSGLWRG